MAIDKEKLIKDIMREAEADNEPVTLEEATEMAEMEIKAKGFKNYVSDKTTRVKTVKPRKVDTEKLEILNMISEFLKSKDINNAIIREIGIDFEMNDSNFNLKLTRHRKK